MSELGHPPGDGQSHTQAELGGNNSETQGSFSRGGLSLLGWALLPSMFSDLRITLVFIRLPVVCPVSPRPIHCVPCSDGSSLGLVILPVLLTQDASRSLPCDHPGHSRPYSVLVLSLSVWRHLELGQCPFIFSFICVPFICSNRSVLSAMSMCAVYFVSFQSPGSNAGHKANT